MAQDKNKTKAQLITETEELRQRLAKLDGADRDLKRAEEALRKREEELDVIFDSVPARHPPRVSADCWMSEGAVKVAVHRLRRRYRDLLLDGIAQTLAEGESLDEELHYFLSAIGT